MVLMLLGSLAVLLLVERTIHGVWDMGLETYSVPRGLTCQSTQ